MSTWGISDYVDEKGESNGKYTISLLFPSDEYKSATTDDFLEKIKEFETQLLNDAVLNSELWFGEKMSYEVVKHMYFPLLKYSKDKKTKKLNYTTPPSLRAKVSNYDSKWNVEIYDTSSKMLFPSEEIGMTPMDFIPKLSSVACVLGIYQIWVGGKGWGCAVKLNQCVVKVKSVENSIVSTGTCQIVLSEEDKLIIEN
jgi:hypothetical protein